MNEYDQSFMLSGRIAPVAAAKNVAEEVALSHASVLSKSSIRSPVTPLSEPPEPLNKRKNKQSPSASTLLLNFDSSSPLCPFFISIEPVLLIPPLQQPYSARPLSALAFPTMEALSMLKYWRGGGGATPSPATTSTVSASSSSETGGDNDDEGPFFDLEFAVPDDDDDEQPEQEEDDEDDDDDAGSGSEDGTDGEREFDFTLSSTAAEARTDPNLALSPSDDLFFKGRLVPLEPAASLHSESNSKSQFPGSFLKSATKFRVFLLGFKRPKSVPENDGGDGPTQAAQKHQRQHGKSFTVKFKVEEVPIVSLFTRDYSSRSASGGKPQKLDDIISDDGVSSSDMKRFSKDVLQKYIKMIKPLYVRVSKRYGDKLRFSGQLSLGTGKAATQEVGAVGEADSASSTAAGKNQKQVNHIPSGLRVVCKHLGKSRSASAVAAAPPGTFQCRRRDDSLLQQQDGIQSAILHCKRSLKASKDQEQGSLSLPRSARNPSCNKSLNCEKGKEVKGEM